MTVPDWWEAALLALASYRIFRLIAKDTILDDVRAWVLRAGDWRPGDNALMPVGFRDGLATFISCPWCAGFWITGIVVGVYYELVFEDTWDKVGGFVVTWLALNAVVGFLAKLDDDA